MNEKLPGILGMRPDIQENAQAHGYASNIQAGAQGLVGAMGAAGAAIAPEPLSKMLFGLISVGNFGDAYRLLNEAEQHFANASRAGQGYGGSPRGANNMSMDDLNYTIDDPRARR